jgi:hypothetical protein
MSTEKQKDKKWQTGTRAQGGFSMPQHNRTAPVERQVPSNFAVPEDPIASPLSKPLQAACPVQDTKGAGVVIPAYENIVVA